MLFAAKQKFMNTRSGRDIELRYIENSVTFCLPESNAMKLLNNSWMMGLLIGLVTSGAMLHAQPAPSGGDSDPTVKAGVEVTVNMSHGEMIAQSIELATQVKDDLRRVRHLQEISRKAKDVIKLTCVNDKFIAIKAQANIFDRAHNELEGANPTGTERVTIYALVVEAAAKVHQLRSDADGCVGETDLGSESLTTSDHPPFPDDPTLGDPFTPDVEPPGYASPYR